MEIDSKCPKNHRYTKKNKSSQDQHDYWHRDKAKSAQNLTPANNISQRQTQVSKKDRDKHYQ